MTIGEKVKTLLEERNQTPQDLALALNISTSSVWKYFKKDNFDTHVLFKIAAHLQVPITCFFEDHTSQNINSVKGNYSFAGSHNNVSGNITVVLPPEGCKKIIDSKGQVTTVTEASLNQLGKPAPTADNDTNMQIYQLQQKIRKLQEMIIQGKSL